MKQCGKKNKWREILQGKESVSEGRRKMKEGNKGKEKYMRSVF